MAFTIIHLRYRPMLLEILAPRLRADPTGSAFLDAANAASSSRRRLDGWMIPNILSLLRYQKEVEFKNSKPSSYHPFPFCVFGQ
jgi:hypothetical protein